MKYGPTGLYCQIIETARKIHPSNGSIARFPEGFGVSRYSRWFRKIDEIRFV
jgi:hypothetical protein